ncbi:MAG: Gfo/Idh/MocA family oxidoreductase [Planctomycetaceae bacterium]|nr:Gfo/Idh/MocA family oxidoreductase [Planctomycetaceae bacterium]
MPPIRLNRRRFLGCSAAAGLALSQGRIGEGAVEGRPVRVGVIGLGTRGTSLLRTLLEMPGAQVVSVCDAEAKHRLRGQGIVEKATGGRPEGVERVGQVLDRDDVDAVVVALPCDLHAEVDRDAIRAGKHLYAEKPLAPTLAACDMLIAEADKAPGVVVHVGYQRRSNPRYRDGVALIHRGELGTPIEGTAAWVSSNGPMNGHGDWLARRARSGDWMVEQAVHVWDVFHWIAGGPPARAFGLGRRDLFADQQPGRDVTDHYSAHLEWADGFHVAFLHSWVAPADDRFTGITLQVMGTAGGLDLGSGTVTFRDKSRPRQTLHPGNQADTRLALSAFLDAVRAGQPVPPPLTLAEARDATLTGLLVRKAVDERRVVTMDEIRAESASGAVSG